MKPVLDCLTCPASFLCVNGWCLHVFVCTECGKLFDADMSIDGGDHYLAVWGVMHLKDVSKELMDAAHNCARWLHTDDRLLRGAHECVCLDVCDDCEPDEGRYRE